MSIVVTLYVPRTDQTISKQKLRKHSSPREIKDIKRKCKIDTSLQTEHTNEKIMQ